MILALLFLLAIPQRGCTGAVDCRVCKNCSSCRHCAKDGGTCGVCTSIKRSNIRVSRQPEKVIPPVLQGPSEPISEHWRWAIKTGADQDARAVPIAVKETTVEKLTSIGRPDVLTRHRRKGQTADRRIDPVETTLYRVRATITGYKMEPDGDYHIVIQGNSPERTMIVEIPDPMDVSTSSRWKSQIKTTREAFAKRFPLAGKRIKRTSQRAIVTGVGFWDKLHGQTGVARNGIELHPVITIQYLD